MKKVCKDCGILKDISKFGTRNNYNKTNKVYYFSFCKPCMVLRTLVWQKKNKEKWSAYQKEWHEKNKDKKNAYKKEWRKRKNV